MSARLVAAGYQVLGFDAAGTDDRLPAGAQGAASLTEVATRAEIVLLSLPDGTASRAVCAGLIGTVARRAGVVVDLSTVGISAARECAAMLKDAGMVYVDAPVSGGVAGARAGTLAMMVGVEEQLFETLRPMLGVLAKNTFRVGGMPGHGQAMKLLNNFLSGTAVAATCEAVIFGAKMGLDLTQMIDVLNASSGRTTASTDKFPRSIIPRSYDFGFAGALMSKDLKLYLANVEAAGVPHEIGQAVANLWQQFDEACPGMDFTFIHKFLEEQG